MVGFSAVGNASLPLIPSSLVFVRSHQLLRFSWLLLFGKCVPIQSWFIHFEYVRSTLQFRSMFFVSHLISAISENYGKASYFETNYSEIPIFFFENRIFSGNVEAE